MSLGHWWSVFVGVLLLGVILACFSGTLPSTIPALFRTPVRYGAVSIGFTIAVALFGGTTPLISEALIGTTGNTIAPAFLLVFAGVVGLVAVLFTREPARRALPGSAPTAANPAEARKTAREQRRDTADDPDT